MTARAQQQVAEAGLAPGRPVHNMVRFDEARVGTAGC